MHVQHTQGKVAFRWQMQPFPKPRKCSLTVGCRATISSRATVTSTPHWGAPNEQDNNEAQEDRGAHGATLLWSRLQQGTRQPLLWSEITPGTVGREQLAQGKAFSSRDNCLAGREPLPTMQSPALESLTHTATSASSPTAVDPLAALHRCALALQLLENIPPRRSSHCTSPRAGCQRLLFHCAWPEGWPLRHAALALALAMGNSSCIK